MKKLKVLAVLAMAVSIVFFIEAIAQQQPGLDWSKFDFVPGDEIIFEDNQEGERNGEFPSNWDLVNGTVENAVLDGENVIMFIKTNTNSSGGIVPMMRNGYEDYLPDEFTVEFDAYFDSPNRTYRVLFYDGKNQSQLNRSTNPGSNNRVDRIRVSQNSVSYESSTNHYPGFGQSPSEDASRSKPGWRRVSISFNKRALKVYLDDARVLNIPNMSYNPLGLTFAYHNPTEGHLGYIKNIRVAKGAVPLYDKMLTDGKIVTTGIRFDVNKATLRPESFGVINEVVNLMKETPELNFSVEGHTDSDGSEPHNQTLSEARAKAVMDEIIKMGISPSRLKSTGHGQSVPIAGNDTPEGKAQNRRVEFVKLDTGTEGNLKEIETETEGLKSYIMKTNTTIDNGGLKFTMTTTAWHEVAEEKLAVEAETLVTGPTGSTLTKNLDIIDSEWRYSINLQENTGRKDPRRNAYNEIFENVKFRDEDSFIQLIQVRGGRFIGNETFLGRNCLVVETGSGKEETKTWYYKGLPLKVVTHNMVSEVTLLEENVSIPVERFIVPAGITIK